MRYKQNQNQSQCVQQQDKYENLMNNSAGIIEKLCVDKSYLQYSMEQRLCSGYSKNLAFKDMMNKFEKEGDNQDSVYN